MDTTNSRRGERERERERREREREREREEMERSLLFCSLLFSLRLPLHFFIPRHSPLHVRKTVPCRLTTSTDTRRAGAIGGVTCTLIATPMELIKAKLQVLLSSSLPSASSPPHLQRARAHTLTLSLSLSLSSSLSPALILSLSLSLSALCLLPRSSVTEEAHLCTNHAARDWRAVYARSPRSQSRDE